MKQIHSFDQLIEELNPALQQLEEKRVRVKNDAMKTSLIWGAIILLLTIIICYFSSSALVLVFGVIFIFIVAIAIFKVKSEPLCEYYKKEIISRLVEVLIEDGRYRPKEGIRERIFNESNLFVSPDRYHSEDLISGVIDKTSFSFAEVHAEERQVTSNGKTTTVRWVTIFKGFLFVADFHKNFIGQTVVARNSFLKLKRGRVKMENPEFERRFDVFSTDQVEARYLLTPSMMERIIALDSKFNKDIVLSFCNSNVIVAINNSTNHFEFSLWAPANNTDTLRREYNLITSMISIVEELNLNTRIWSKE